MPISTLDVKNSEVHVANIQHSFVIYAFIFGVRVHGVSGVSSTTYCFSC